MSSQIPGTCYSERKKGPCQECPGCSANFTTIGLLLPNFPKNELKEMDKYKTDDRTNRRHPRPKNQCHTTDENGGIHPLKNVACIFKKWCTKV